MKNLFYTLTATLLVSSLLIFIACNKNSGTGGSGTNTDPNHIPAEKTVTASLQGRVVDENGLPVEGAAVASGGTATATDVNGIFTFKDISMSSRFGFVKVNKQGYFTGSRSVITNAGASNYVSIQLIPRVEKGHFMAATGGRVVVQAGDTVSFTGTSVVNAATNAGYTGTVHVFATYLDPTDVRLAKYMPGDLRGVDTSGRETGLQSFGMMGVELEGDAAEKLQIAAGQKATLSWAIPVSLQATAPATIPLWYFNDSTGRWIEQGTATRQGNSYVGQVGHFSYWNCDAPSETVNFKVHLKDQHGNPVPYTYIQFQTADWGTRGGYTDSSGYAQGLIPKGQAMLFQVVSECGNMLAGANVGPALSDQDLGTVTVTIEHAELTLTGTVVDCYGKAVSNGFVNAYLDGLNYRAALVNGAFTLPVNRCYSSSVSVALTAVDAGASQQSSKTITASTGTVDAGQLSACGVSNMQFINFDLDGGSYSIAAPPDSIAYNYYSYQNYYGVYAYGGAAGNLPQVNFRLPVMTGPGNYSIDSMFVTTQINAYYFQNESMSCSVTSFGAVNEFIDGNFNGTLYTFSSGTMNPKPITGSFRIKRTQ